SRVNSRTYRSYQGAPKRPIAARSVPLTGVARALRQPSFGSCERRPRTRAHQTPTSKCWPSTERQRFDAFRACSAGFAKRQRVSPRIMAAETTDAEQPGEPAHKQPAHEQSALVPVLVGVLVTALAALLAYFLPVRHAATGVGFCFFIAT